MAATARRDGCRRGVKSLLQSMPVRFAVGLGLFLWGMALMSRGLRVASGESMRRVLAALTGNHLTGLVAGAAVTAVIQSSSATTVMVVGLVNGGWMSPSQALGVIMGANIGTTATAHLIAFELTAYALPAMGLGVFCFLLGTGRVRSGWARAIFGFGCLFGGMGMMGRAVEPLARSPAFLELVTVYGHHPLMGVLTGALTTAVVQSSSATIGMLQALAGQGLVSMAAAFPILLGNNIGTCSTALLAGMGASADARRAAVLHLVINTVGTLVFMAGLPLATAWATRSSPDAVRQIANAHTLFNVVSAALLLPVANQLLQLVYWLVPGAPAGPPGPRCLVPRPLAPGDRPAVVHRAYRVRAARHLLAESRATGRFDRASWPEARREHSASLQRRVAALRAGTGGMLLREQPRRRRVFPGLTRDLEGIAGHAGQLCRLVGERGRISPSARLMTELEALQQVITGTLDDILVCLKSGHRGPARRAAKKLQGAALRIGKLRRELARAGPGEGEDPSHGWALQVISCLVGIAGHARSMTQRLVSPGQ